MPPKNKGIYRVFRTKEELRAHDDEVAHFARVELMDKVTVALGRMGFREARFMKLNETLTVVDDEYNAEFREDLKADKHMVYSLACLDRELKQYTGKMFVPVEERYK